MTEVIDLGSTDLNEEFRRINGELYVVCEAPEGVVVTWRNMQMSSIEFSDGGKPKRAGGLAGIEPYLVSECLFKCSEDDRGEERDINERKKVTLGTINRWPTRIVKPLYELAKQISKLDDEEAAGDDAKNEQKGTTTG